MGKLRQKVNIILAQFIVILLMPLNVYGEEICINGNITEKTQVMTLIQFMKRINVILILKK